MTSPVQSQPPLATYGRTAKELLGLGGRSGKIAIPPVPVVPLGGLYGFGFRMVQQPSAATFYGWLLRPWYPVKWATHVRLVTDISVAGAVGSYFLLQRCTDITDPDDDANWDTIGQIRDCIVEIDQLGPLKGKWVEIGTVAKDEDDNILRAVAVGGDGVASPEHGLIWAEFEDRRVPLAERWYWRDQVPGEILAWDNPDTFYPDFWVNGSPGPTTWLTPIPSAVTAAPGILSVDKDTTAGAAVVSSTSTDAHIDVSGIVKRFIGPPLRKQTIPPWTYKMGFAAQAPSGGVAGHAKIQVGIFRPSAPTSPVIVWTEDLWKWFRFVTKQLVYTLDVDEEFDVEDGDRYFIDIIGNVEVAGGISTTNGLGVNISFDGAGLEDFIDGADLGGNDPASWVEFPLLAYLTKDPT